LERKSNEPEEEETPPEKLSTLVNKSYELTSYSLSPPPHLTSYIGVRFHVLNNL